MNGEILLQGIVGSRAYGFAHEGSDTDRLGLFAVPTKALFGLARLQESHVTTKPDLTLHEAKKWCQLALKCNPTAMELVWLPEGLYEIRQPLGDELIGLRKSFLSASAVRNAYLGYAHQQFEKLKRTTIKMDGHEDPEIKRARRSKNARHLVRLVLQGLALHTEGMVPIRLPSPEWVKETAEEIIRDPRVGSLMLKGAHLTFDEPGVLPEQPDVAAVEEWLHAVRYAFL